MKKILSLVVICALCLAMVLSVSSCSMLGIYLLNGTYENEYLGSFSFKLNGEMAYTIKGTTFAGEYEIEKLADDSLQIELDFESDSIALTLLDGEHEFGQGDDNGTKYIEIGGVKYTKAK